MKQINLAQQIAKVLSDKKAQNIVILNVGHLTVITDYMVIATGRSVLQTRALADEVDDKMAQLGISLRSREGLQEGRWIVLDYGTVLVHIFHPDDREHYNLERLWADGTNSIPLPPETDEVEE